MREVHAEGEAMSNDLDQTLQIAIEIGTEIPVTPITRWEEAGYPGIFSWGDVFERAIEEPIMHQA